MANLESEWRGLSIRQPWIDLILKGEKTIEIREWTYPPALRGRFLLHCAQGLDWKTIALFGGRRHFAHPRGALVGVADLYDVIEISVEENWAKLARQHRVIHPPNGGRSVFGLLLRNVRPLTKPIKTPGGPYFFLLRSNVLEKVVDTLGAP
jgi:hypothetical protein